MKKFIASLIVLIAALLTLTSSPAEASTYTNCTSSQMTNAEFNTLYVGESLANVATAVGSAGVYVAAESTSTTVVYRWSVCVADGMNSKVDWYAPFTTGTPKVLKSLDLNNFRKVN